VPGDTTAMDLYSFCADDILKGCDRLIKYRVVVNSAKIVKKGYSFSYFKA
jgi:hypothetical protein